MAHHDRQLTLSHDDFWGRKLACLEGIPLDILHLFADHLSVQDLVALSTASQSLRYLLSDPGVWRKFYTRTGFLLPPGPHDWQSASYLVDVLLRAEKLYSVWPSSSSCPEILYTRSMSFGCDVTFSVLLGRWLLVAEGSTLVCYDSRRSDIPNSVKTLFDDDANRPILRVFSVGSVGEDGVLAFAVLLFDDSFTIAKILMDQGEPSTIQTVLTSKPNIVESWADHVDVRLYHRLLVVNIGESSSDWESFGRLVIMDIDTLRRYHIPPATHGAPFNPVQTIAFFLATKTHLIRVIEFSNRHKVRFKVECFPLPTTHGTPESDILYPSHQSGIIYGPKLRQCAVSMNPPQTWRMGRHRSLCVD
ncbi:hypothetical protein JVT61DRAFT_10033 [Boletus reticuloceps]|uniref:F-box domain-containing protein n=1 Tax=Boletus reticuloceps TaxID=495285 RepID=A0A8I3AEL0_9AGAM|nr:hypothetical protein JVT61DRAFT_10033 [Boletus reticuloceps]